jgi:hypothetical protein
MKPDDLAKYMRDRALLIESDERLDEYSLRDFAEVEAEKQKRIRKIEELKKLYFNAGRWVGGARDHVAQQAYERMRAQEK